jgi:hypothetical protein
MKKDDVASRKSLRQIIPELSSQPNPVCQDHKHSVYNRVGTEKELAGDGPAVRLKIVLLP